MNISNLVIDRILRGVMFSTSTREALWSVSQISSFSISITTDSQDAVDGSGTPLMTFYRAKQCEISAENALWDLTLFAAQGGGDNALQSSSAQNKFNVPIFDEIEMASATSATLTHTPILPTGETYAVPYVYVLNGDGSMGKKLTCGAATATGVYTQAGTTLTFASGDLAVGDTIIAFYEYEANGTSGSQAVKLQNTAKDFPKAGKFVLEILCCDPCDKTTLYYAYLVMPSATLAPDVDLDFATDATHSFTLRAQQDYCDKQKLLYSLIVPEAASN
jgi:hypothetical protein